MITTARGLPVSRLLSVCALAAIGHCPQSALCEESEVAVQTQVEAEVATDEPVDEEDEGAGVLRAHALEAHYELTPWLLPRAGTGHLVGLGFLAWGGLAIHVSAYLPAETFALRARLGWAGANIPFRGSGLALQVFGTYAGLLASFDESGSTIWGPLAQIVPVRLIFSPPLVGSGSSVALRLSVGFAVAVHYLMQTRDGVDMGTIGVNLGLQVGLGYAFYQ